MDTQPVCPICASTTRELLAPKSAAPGSATTVRCTSCRFIYRTSPTTTYQDDSPHLPSYSIPDALWRDRLGILEQAVGRGTLLNIGAGATPFLQLAHNAGWHVADITPEGCRQQTEGQSDIDVHNSLSEGIWPAGHFDAVTIWSGLEYSARPAALLSLAAHYCRVDGVLAIQSMNGDKLGKYWQVDSECVSEQLPTRLFTPAALQRFLGRFGFRSECLLPLKSDIPVMAMLARYIP